MGVITPLGKTKKNFNLMEWLHMVKNLTSRSVTIHKGKTSKIEYTPKIKRNLYNLGVVLQNGLQIINNDANQKEYVYFKQ